MPELFRVRRSVRAYQGCQRPAAAANYPRGITSALYGEDEVLQWAVWIDNWDIVLLLRKVINEYSMDAILRQVLSFPPHPPPAVPPSDKDYDKQIRAVVQVLNVTSAKKLTGGVTTGEDLLDVSEAQHGNAVPSIIQARYDG